MPTNFDLAPASKIVDGLFAVCIDIQSITGTINFDAASSTAQADVSIEFIMGADNGCPIFDLRQTISQAWLDGTVISPTLLSAHDFGGGTNAELRIVEQTLSAGSTHTLRLLYNLGPPLASMVGSYQPGLNWNAGPRLAFNFGFTDLGAGRYLESWIPANLIFDQFQIDLTFIVENTAISHEVISNGLVTAIASNQWQVQWPQKTSALSTLLEIRAADTLSHQSDNVTLPLSGNNISIDAWKLASSSINLTTQINLIKGFLSDNENNVGSYLHGNRFVAFFITGGMEYDGGTTTGTGPLRHETFHSWWGRGIKPASQNDGWWDEAWTVYNMAGANGSIPFDFSRAPVMLSSLNQWNRRTPGLSYSEGDRVFNGLAALQNPASLRSAMNDFYKTNTIQPTTTKALESHLLCQIGKKEIVDGFHRFVYGFSDSAIAPDLWLKDHPDHGGANEWDGVYWNSPDLWVRHFDDDGTTHQDPEYGQDNWFYARVRNRSSVNAQHFMVSFTAQNYAGMQFSFPEDFLPCTSATAEFNLGAGETRVVKARWPRSLVPPPGTHACLLASTLTRGDHTIAGTRVWENNNLAQKNLTVVDLEPNSWIVIPFLLRNLERRLFPWFYLELSSFSDSEAVEAEIIHPQLESLKGFSWQFDKRPTMNRKTPDHQLDQSKSLQLLDCGVGHDDQRSLNYSPWTSDNPDSSIAKLFEHSSALKFRQARRTQLKLTLPHRQPYLFGLRIKVAGNSKSGSVLRFNLAQKMWPCRNLQGGISVKIRVKDRVKQTQGDVK